MRPSSTMTPTDYRQIEQTRATRRDFIYAVSEAMNTLEYSRVLDWATLDCKEYKAPENHVASACPLCQAGEPVTAF